MTRKGRPAAAPVSQLGVAIQLQRADESVHAAGDRLGLNGTTLARLERGVGRPSYDTAVKLAAWLGWTVEQVMRGSSGFEPSEHSDAKPTGFEPSIHSEDFRKR